MENNPADERAALGPVMDVPGDDVVVCGDCATRRWMDCDINKRLSSNDPGMMAPCSNCRWYGGKKCRCVVVKTSMNDIMYKQAAAMSLRKLRDPKARADNPMSDINPHWRGSKNGPPPALPDRVKKSRWMEG